MRTALSIAGSDCSGGAGIQADIKTMLANGVFAMTVITAVTAQNTTGVKGIWEVPAEFVSQQIDAVFEDIPPNAVKIGMISSAENAERIAERLAYYRAENIVTDPVMISTGGTRLISEEAEDILKKRIFPISRLITPNIPEAETISGVKIASLEDMERVAAIIYEKYGCNVLCKGGHSAGSPDDLLYTAQGCMWFAGKRVNVGEVHGTGCTLSSAIAASLAKGYDLPDSVKIAKEYITGAVSSALDIGKGSRQPDHGFDLKSKFI